MTESTYAVAWQQNGSQGSGRLELGPEALTLEGRNEGVPVRFEVPYRDVRSFQLARENGDRLLGRPTLVLTLDDGELMRIVDLVSPGAVTEVADRLAPLHHQARASLRAAVVIPFKSEAREAVVDLLEHGPPFDPKALGLESHEVFLADDEAIFVFQGVPSTVLRRLLVDQVVSDAAARWAPVLAGRPQFADQVYAWAG